MTISSPSLNKITPTDSDSTLAQVSGKILANCLNSEQDYYKIEVISDSAGSKTVTIPVAALSLLVDILEHISKGNGVKIVPIKQELSTSEAADLLHVSRPYLVNLLESGKIPFRKVGPRRRLLLSDLMDYKNQIDAQREQTLATLAAQAQELNMGYE